MSVNSYQYVCEPESDDLNICAMCSTEFIKSLQTFEFESYGDIFPHFVVCTVNLITSNTDMIDVLLALQAKKP